MYHIWCNIYCKDIGLLSMHDDILLKVGDKLKTLRIEKGYTSYENFAVDNELGRMQYWRLENGKTNLTINSLLKILEIHEISLKDFFKDFD